MKTKLGLILICVLVLSLFVVFASCGKPVCDHAYDNTCDVNCNVCGAVREIAHDFSKYESNIAKHVKLCAVCGETDENTREAHVFNEELSCVCGYTLTKRTTYKVGGSYVEIFDSPDGKRIGRRYYDTDGILTDQNEYFYDEAGNNIRIEESGEDFLQSGRFVYAYDSQGRVLREDRYVMDDSSEMTLQYYRIFTYSEDGRYATKEEFTGDGEKEAEIRMMLYENGTVASEESRWADGSFCSLRVYSYDANGKRIGYVESSFDRERVVTNNANGDVIKDTIRYADGSMEIRTYTEEGNPYMNERVDADGTKTTCLYTEKGELIKETVEPADNGDTENVE